MLPIRGKEPLTAHGHKDATTERSRIMGMFNAAGNRATGYGIAAGQRSRRVYVDVDGPEGVAEAKRRNLSSERIVRSGREVDGYHLEFEVPPGLELRSCTLAPGLEFIGEGKYVVGPGSVHPETGNVYRIARGGEPSPLPEWIIEAARADAPVFGRTKASPGFAPVSIDAAGPPIRESEPGRNLTLARIAGRLHDGSRDLAQLTRDLEAINEARCEPPLESSEVARIARNIHRREPCSPGPGPSPSSAVRAKLAYLEAAAAGRPVRGKGGATGWANYYAGLEALRRFGRDHPDGLTLTLDARTWGQLAGNEASTVSRWLRRCPLVEVLERGRGRRASTVLFRVPKIGGESQHSSPLVVGIENGRRRSVAVDPLLRTLYRSRWSSPERKARRGVVSGTRKVREGWPSAPRGGVLRMGKSRAALLHVIRQTPGCSRAERAARLGVKPDSLKKPLKWLQDAGLIVRTSRGHYEPVGALPERLDDVRAQGGEPEAERLQIARHERERVAYRERDRIKADRAPTQSEMDADPRREYREKRREVGVLVARGMDEKRATLAVFGADGFTSDLERAETIYRERLEADA